MVMAMAGVMANVDMKADNVNNLPDIEDIVTGLQGSKRTLSDSVSIFQ